MCCGSVLSLVQILFSFIRVPYPKTKENKISTKDKTEPQCTAYIKISRKDQTCK